MFPFALLAALGMTAMLLAATYIFERLHLRWTGLFVIGIAPLILMDVIIEGDITFLRMLYFLLWTTAALVRAIYLNGLHHDEIKRRKDHRGED